MNFARVSDFHSLRNFFEDSLDTSCTVVHVNIRSLRKHWNEFKVICSNINNSVDVFVLSEINIAAEMTSQFSMSGYNSTFTTRPCGRGGGIAVYVRDNWSVNNLTVTFNHAECIALNITNELSSICFLAIYRPPSEHVRDFLDELDGALRQLSTYDQLCILGDFNIDILTPSKSSVCTYLNTLSGNGISSLINAPTREEILSGRLVVSCIDHINLRTCSQRVQSAVITQKLADHYFISCRWSNVNPSPQCSLLGTRTSVIDTAKFDRLVSSFDWNGFLQSVSSTDIYQKFAHVINMFYVSSKKEICVKRRRPDHYWLNADILAAIAEKNNLWARYRRSPGNTVLKSDFQICRNMVNAMIRSAKRKYFHKKFSESRSNMTQTWHLINEFRGNPSASSVDNVLKKNFGPNLSTVVRDFNSFFATFSGKSRDSSITFDNVVTASAFLPPLNDVDLHSLLFSFKSSKSPGIDGIRVSDLRRNYEVIKHVLLYMLNGFIESCVLPDELKTAIVRPLYKGGGANRIENYRPISILPIIVQILEKHVFQVMSSFLDVHNVLSPSQFGFIRGKGTQPLLEDFSDLLFSGFERNLVSCALFLDVSKAFDTVSHSVLLRKLYSYGFRGPFFSFLSNYLMNRSQLVIAAESRSPRTMLKAGVPQGSILSPLLYNLFVNDISKSLSEVKLYQYADDTVIVTRHLNFENAARSLQCAATSLMDWFQQNLMDVNVNKTKLICFHNPLKYVHLDFPFVLHHSKCIPCKCVSLEYVESVKYLGILFDCGLTWNTQFMSLCAKLRSVSCLLYNTKSLMPFSVRKIIAHTLAYSVLRYGITVFGNCSAQWHGKIDSILKNILKSVSYGLQIPDDSDLFNFLQFPCLKSLFTRTVVQRYFWSDDFKRENVPTHSLRSQEKFKIPFVRTRYGRNTREYYVPETFNNLHSEILQANSLSQLKKSMKLYLSGGEIT